DGGIDQKVLPQTLGKGKSVAGKDIPNDRDVGQVFHEKLLSDGNSFGTNSFMASIIAQKSPPAEDVYKKVWEVHRKHTLYSEGKRGLLLFSLENDQIIAGTRNVHLRLQNLF